jgi:dihydrofolate synthase/folylpolyglutamate synthase
MSVETLLAPLETRGIRLGLDATRALLERLGSPHLAAPSVLIAGTNGKGSTAALLAAMATAAGYRTGLYTSPHLERVEERVRIDGRWVESAELEAALREVLAAADAPTYFEAMTVTAFLVFARRRVDLMVLEVGLGGRLDATNVADPQISIVTAIGLDHTEYLGPTLASIAREKAGIFRRGRPAIWGPQEVEADASLRREAEAAGAEVVEVREPSNLTLRLAGEHQRWNVALAARAAALLTIDPAAIERGAEACTWPGRLEGVEVSRGRHVLLDGAHNPAGIATLLTHLERTDGPFDLLFGAMADKELVTMLPPLAAHAIRVTLTTAPNPRAAPADDLAAMLGGRAVTVEPAVPLALDHALDALASPRLVICGSLYLIGAVRTLLRRRFGVPAPAADLFSLRPEASAGEARSPAPRPRSRRAPPPG